jgi:cathepsin X
VYRGISVGADETCQLYEAKDFACSALNTCRTCSPDGTCSAITKYRKYQLTQYGSVSGESDMMAEVYARGPIAVGVDAGPLETYTGGILWDKTGAQCTSGRPERP